MRFSTGPFATTKSSNRTNKDRRGAGRVGWTKGAEQFWQRMLSLDHTSSGKMIIIGIFAIVIAVIHHDKIERRPDENRTSCQRLSVATKKYAEKSLP
jgi:hypothetical protein